MRKINHLTKYILFLVVLMAIACQKTSIQNEVATQNTLKTTNIDSNIPRMVNAKQENSIQNQTQNNDYEPECFTGELKIGRRKLNRVEISTYKKGDSLFVKTKFYAKLKSEWILKNEFDVEKNGGLPIQPEIKDFNGDGFKDITFVSDFAGRGANELRSLFIYNSPKDELVYIENSRDFPNLEPNPLLKSLTSWHFTGSTTTIFLRLQGNKLAAFASVDDRGNERTVMVIDKNGKEKLLRREKRKDDGFDRYINFNPVKTY